ncbi:MAG TPA: LLM class F420-dependent oxidoreductase [Intrasporangium sp.]|uniref:LLM class F420-dependent oxidoreductase n=1 Tax=Intrasporangium sp. TaxID=1925024 RepID=UPI002D7A20CD|nr:LLM class F420-dependent oxidoreductase [Intrasporangium sp.]HET7398565.1 LLM class F420-dependent oxidoreductase [Intrasporangium sp.]
MSVSLRIFVEPQQGATYDDILVVATATEALGFDGFFRSDHFIGWNGDGHPGPTDAWTTLAGLARDTRRIRLGTLVTSATFRLPGLLSIQAAGVDQMSGGRLELGIGTGWVDVEHTAYGIPFPPLRERFERLEEQLAIITGLWATPPGSTFSYSARHYRLVDSPALTKPVQSGGVPIIVGGVGRNRTPALAARYAAEFNAPLQSIEDTAALYAAARSACERVGRSAPELTLSAAQTICLGKDDATTRRRAEAIGRDPDELRHHGLVGSPAEIVDKIGTLAALGTTRLYLQVLDMSDLDHLADIADTVAPQLSR